MKQPNFAAMSPVVAKAIEQMMAEQGDKFSLEKINLAELERRTGISRARLRRMKEHGFEDTEHAAKGRKASTTLLSSYTGILDGLLKNGVTNSAVCLSRLRANGYIGSQTTIKNYILAHNISFRLLAMRLLRKGTVGGVTLPAPERRSRWTGDLPKSTLLPERNTLLPALLWSATTAVSGM
ncbi:hypothetical protein [Flavonifractor sp. An112]|uniref:hypothetical protein n=1 Tax=Flavonifractor sp. An112 TaxID=1965544 RepID=UPI0019D1C0C2|nr:hypothetical protein [Flavonifractor sp. An112]